MPESETSASQRSTRNPRDAGAKPPQPAQEQSSPGSQALMDPQPDYGLHSYVGRGRLTDRIAIVTGADSGIGRAVALAFAREGADVVIGYLNSEADARHTAEVVQAAGRKAITISADVGVETHVKALVDQVVQQFGRIDILVNNAAHQGKAVERFEEIDAERLETTFRTNIFSMFHLVRHALPHMAEGSAIINVASIQAYQPSPAILDYASTKGAIVTFTKGLALELIQRGIRVNCVAPGPVWTPLVVQSYDAEKNASFGKDSPMGRPAQPAELAPAFVFLASDEASYVNGEVLGVTGGKPLA
jgi:NAD(P)-dependent dehydrogenase (short-subunit alcohol dehydrogenase family)